MLLESVRINLPEGAPAGKSGDTPAVSVANELASTFQWMAETHGKQLHFLLEDFHSLDSSTTLPIYRRFAADSLATLRVIGIQGLIADSDPDAIMVSVAADHVIQDADAYRDSINLAVRTAQTGDRLVTIGLRPTYAATGFGYIRVAEREGEAYPVEEFVEKPTLVRAEEYLASGRYYWNLSMFAWRASAFLDELERVAPKHYEGLLAVRAGNGGYADLPNVASNRLVMI